MYPGELLNLFPPYPRTDLVFVAMSFDHQFDVLWRDILEPAVTDANWSGSKLRAHRVNLTRKSDSIITEIVQHIAQSRLVLADISTSGWHHRWLRRVRPIRNSNVMYEVGIAHASRLAEEVILIRGDIDQLDFDVAGVRVHQYPENPAAAKAFVQDLIEDAVKAVDQRRSLAVQRALRSLSPPAYFLLHAVGDIPHPKITTVREALGAQEQIVTIRHLLAEGLLEATYKPLAENFMEQPSAELFAYRVTPFGIAVYQAARTELRFNEAFRAWVNTPPGRAWLDAQAKRPSPPPEAATDG